MDHVNKLCTCEASCLTTDSKIPEAGLFLYVHPDYAHGKERNIDSYHKNKKLPQLSFNFTINHDTIIHSAFEKIIIS